MLHHDVLLHIFSFLPLNHLLHAVPLVSKSFQQLCQHQMLWKQITIGTLVKDCCVPHVVQHGLAKVLSGAKLERLLFENCSRLTDESLMSLLPYCSNSLQALYFNGNYAFDKFEALPPALSQLILNNSKTLTCLHVYNAPELLSFNNSADYQQWLQMLTSCPLQELRLDRVKLTRSKDAIHMSSPLQEEAEDTLPRRFILQRKKIDKNNWVYSIGVAGFSNLKSLHLSNITSTELKFLEPLSLQLTSLRLDMYSSGAQTVSDEKPLAHLISQLDNLEQLSIKRSNANNIVQAVGQNPYLCKSLRSLRISGCTTNGESFTSLLSCTQLQSLIIKCFFKIDTLFKTCLACYEQLHVLKLRQLHEPDTLALILSKCILLRRLCITGFGGFPLVPSSGSVVPLHIGDTLTEQLPKQTHMAHLVYLELKDVVMSASSFISLLQYCPNLTVLRKPHVELSSKEHPDLLLPVLYITRYLRELKVIFTVLGSVKPAEWSPTMLSQTVHYGLESLNISMTYMDHATDCKPIERLLLLCGKKIATLSFSFEPSNLVSKDSHVASTILTSVATNCSSLCELNVSSSGSIVNLYIINKIIKMNGKSLKKLVIQPVPSKKMHLLLEHVSNYCSKVHVCFLLCNLY